MRNLSTLRPLSILGLFLLLFLSTTSIYAQTINAVDDAFTLDLHDGATDFDVTTNDNFGTFFWADFSIVKNPKQSTKFNFDNETGIFTYTPRIGFVGRDTFKYAACIMNSCDTAMVILTVNPHKVHTAINDYIELDFLEIMDWNYVNDNDNEIDGQSYTYTLLSKPKYGIAAMDQYGYLSYSSTQDFAGVDTFRYRSCDEYGICSEAKVTVKLLARPPVAVDDYVEVAYNRTEIFKVYDNDTDPNGDSELEPYNYKVLKQSAGSIALFDRQDGDLIYTPAKDFKGTDTLLYIATDGYYFDTARVIINVLPPALIWVDNVVMDFDLVSINNDEHYLDDYVTYDIDFDDVTFKMYKPAKYGKINFNVDVVSYTTTNKTFVGRDTASYIACTQNGVCDTALIIVNVTNSNTAPIAIDDNFYTTGDQVYDDVMFNDDDLEFNIVSATLLTAAKFGFATLDKDGTFTYDPNRGEFGTDTLLYRLCDAFGLCDTAMIFIDVDTKNVTPTNFDIISNKKDVCIGGKVDFSIFINENNITQGLWEESTDGVNFIRISTTATQTFSPNTATVGIKYIRCITTARDTSNILSIAVNPSLVIISNPKDANLTYWVGTSDADSSAVFKVEPSVNPNTLNFQWQSSDDGKIWMDMVENSVNSGVESDELTLIKPRINADKYYRVRMMPNQQGCGGMTSATATLTIKSKPLPVGTRPNNGAISDKVFPNPTTGQVEVYLRTSAGAEITISNLVGQVLKSERINGQYARLDLSGYINGTYLLTIKTAIGFETMKIVKY
jgi:hypothetical protein